MRGIPTKKPIVYPIFLLNVSSLETAGIAQNNMINMMANAVIIQIA